MKTENFETDLFNKIALLLNEARKKVVKSVNTTMVETYYKVGEIIVEEEQNGSKTATYGKQTLQKLSDSLTKKFGKGFSVENLNRMRYFYNVYSVENSSTLLTNLNEMPDFYLSWSHYLKLMRIKNVAERQFYEIESRKNNWSLRELKRQFDTALYERIALSKDQKSVKRLSEKGQIIEEPADLIKDPYILEFLGLPEKHTYSESKLEEEIMNHLQSFLLELGKGFSFVGRQVRFTFDEKHFRVDLVFYNRFLRCFVLIDLKIGEVLHQDLGQMQMYVNYYDRFIKMETENPTIGIILCKERNKTLVEITLPKENSQIFASEYLTILPSKEAFKNLLEQHLK